ncbi:MAG: TrkA family potassium uptake protein [Candidatus Aenigmatarchaeota archaeon]
MRLVIAGGGGFGERLAEEFSKSDDVIVIEKDESRADFLGERLQALVLLGDASDKIILRHAGVERCDVFVAATGDDNTNSSLCELAKSFGVKKIISRLNNPENEGLFSGSGAVTINIMDCAIKEFKRVCGIK